MSETSLNPSVKSEAPIEPSSAPIVGSNKSIKPLENPKEPIQINIQNYASIFSQNPELNFSTLDSDSEETEEEGMEMRDPNGDSPVIFTINQLQEIILMTIDGHRVSQHVDKLNSHHTDFKKYFKTVFKSLNGINMGCFDAFIKVKDDLESTTKGLFETQEFLNTTRSKMNREIRDNAEQVLIPLLKSRSKN